MTMTMADSMTDKTPNHPTPVQVRRGRRMALLLFAVGFGPMILATIMYYTGWLNPSEQANQGSLIQPSVPVRQLNLVQGDGRPLAERFAPPTSQRQWLMIVAANRCGENCEALLYLSRQVNVALGKDANRVARAVYLAEVPEELESRLATDYDGIERLTAGDGRPAWPPGANPADAPLILLVDPLGNVMMQYTATHSGEDILKDLKRLLKLSQIG